MYVISKLRLLCLSRKERLAAVGAVVGIYAVMEGMGITCPILFLTGISCAGCGMSRAWLSLLHLHFSEAYSYHPLFWLPAGMIPFLLSRNKIQGKITKMICVCVIGAFIAVYFVRMFDEKDAIVVFQPQNGLIFRIITENI